MLLFFPRLAVKSRKVGRVIYISRILPVEMHPQKNRTGLVESGKHAYLLCICRTPLFRYVVDLLDKKLCNKLYATSIDTVQFSSVQYNSSCSPNSNSKQLSRTC